MPIRGTSDGVQQRQHLKPLSLERSASEATVRAKEALLGVVAPGNLRKQQSGAMLASVPSLCAGNVKQSTSNHTSDSLARKSEDMESSADSGGSSESSTMSDGDSVNIHSSQYLLRSTSGASMVTSDVEFKERETKSLPGTGSMLEENEGENEVDEDLNTRPESPTRVSDSETHSIQREPESAATTWTDDKHSSFLNSMEATFVRSLYGQQGLGHLGVHGNSVQIDDDCVESRPVDAYGCCTSHPTELFELVQGGHQLKSFHRPHGLEPPQATTAVLANPWVRHFKQKIVTSEILSNHPSACSAEVIATPAKEVVSVVDLSQMNQSSMGRDENVTEAPTKHIDAKEKEQRGASEDIDTKEIHSGAEVLEVEQGFRLWQNRLHIGGQTVTNPTSRKDMASWVLKRPSTFEENADIFVTKRIKSTQQELAKKDLEMLEQYNAKQRAESVQAAVEHHSEQATLEHARKVVEASVEQPGPSLASEPKDARKVVGRSAMDQVVPLLGRMDSYESRSSVSFPDLNAPFNLSTGAACTINEPCSEGREKRNLSSVPDLNAPLRFPVLSVYTTNQPTINFTKDGEAVASAWSPKPEAGSIEERHFYDLVGASYQQYVQGVDDDGRNLSLELQTKCLEAGEAHECEPQLSPMSNSKTWTWGLGGLRRRLHDTVVPAQPSRPLRDGIHLSDPALFRSSGQQV